MFLPNLGQDTVMSETKTKSFRCLVVRMRHKWDFLFSTSLELLAPFPVVTCHPDALDLQVVGPLGGGSMQGLCAVPDWAPWSMTRPLDELPTEAWLQEGALVSLFWERCPAPQCPCHPTGLSMVRPSPMVRCSG